MTSRVKMLFLNYEPSNCDCSKAIEKVGFKFLSKLYFFILITNFAQLSSYWFNHQNADRIYKNFKRD